MNFLPVFDVSTSTPGADIIFAIASSSIGLFGATVPFWLGWLGIAIAIFLGAAMFFAVIYAVSAASNGKHSR